MDVRSSTCSIVYSYVDLVVRNDTDITFEVLVTVVFARNEAFIRAGGELFRRNEIWRTVVDKRTGRQVRDELVKRNCARVTYEPVDVSVIDCDLA